jgi:hypothetical protein
MTTGAWLNGPCTDPMGRMLRAADGRILRALFREREADALAVLEHAAVRALMEEGLVVRMAKSGSHFEGYGAVVESERAPFDVPCARFSFGALRQAALGWLEVVRRLLPADLCLTDAHYGNFMLFARNAPRWIDLGSMRDARVLPEERPFPAFSLFWVGMAAPLLLLAREPARARLARLSVADQPLQGPRFAENEPPLAVSGLVEDEKRELLSACAAVAPREALHLAAEFIGERTVLPAVKSDALPALDSKLTAHIGGALAARACGSVACIGAQAHFGAEGAFARRDVLVIEPSAARVRQVEEALQAGTPARSVALCQEHPLNRLFMREALRADAVLAVDPLRSLAHPSGAEHANIAELLGNAASRAVVVVAPYEQRAATRQMLEGRFGAAQIEHFGWPYGGWDVMVCAKS